MLCYFLLLHLSHIPTYIFLTRYDENMQSMGAGYPREIIHDFPGIGKKVDAVFQDRGKDYPLSPFCYH